MMTTGKTMKLLLTLAALFVATGCEIQYGIPTEGETNFLVTDPTLATLVRDGAEDWAANGLEIASYVTVNSGNDGVPVMFVARQDLPFACKPDKEKAKKTDPHYADACTTYEGGHFKAIYVSDDVTATRLPQVVKHELIHVLVPNATHIEDDTVAAVFHKNSTSSKVTAADMEHLAEFAVCNAVEPVEAPKAARLAPVLTSAR